MVTHAIHSEGVVYTKQYRLPPAQLEKAEEIVDEMLEQGVVEESSSEFNSPIAMVAKKDGSVRFCVDMRLLNAKTAPVKFPLPTPQECFDHLANSHYFSSMDMLWACWSVSLRDSDRRKTAFTVRNRKFHFTCMPFGLRNAPSTFCHLVNMIFTGIAWDFVMAFLDDILCYSGPCFQTHLSHLQQIFQRLIQANIKLKISKCKFGAAETQFLGHIVSRTGLKPDPANIKAVQTLRRPETKKQVRSFLGMTGYFRQFVPNFSSIAAPLYKLTKNDQLRVVKWNDDTEWAFQTLKDHLTTPPVLAFADFEKTFIVETDASRGGLGAVLLQQHETGKRVIAYASRLCSPQERNYSATEIECLGVIFSYNSFIIYLLNKRFQLVTDHKSLQHLKLLKNPGGRIARWLMMLMEFDFDHVYRKGILNKTADALSRLPTTASEQTTVEQVNNISPAISIAQKGDQFCKPIIDYLKGQNKNGMAADAETIYYSRHMGLDSHGILWHMQDYQGSARRRGMRIQLVVPETLRRSLLKWCHEGHFAAHVGRDRALEVLREGYFWKNMFGDLTNYIQHC
ncbi:unnamed protein product [Heterosigma akashiwo]